MILSLTSNQVSLRNELTDMMKENQGALARKRRLEIEGNKVSSEKSAVDRRLETMDSQIRNVREKVETLKTQRDNQGELQREVVFDQTAFFLSGTREP